MPTVALSKRSKRYKEREKVLRRDDRYSLEEAVKAIKKIQPAKYDESVTLDFQLGIKADQANESVRGTVSLPHGTGKKIRVICFCKGEGAREAGKPAPMKWAERSWFRKCRVDGSTSIAWSRIRT